MLGPARRVRRRGAGAQRHRSGALALHLPAGPDVAPEHARAQGRLAAPRAAAAAASSSRRPAARFSRSRSAPLEAVAEGRRLLDALGRGEGGQLALGASPAVSTYALPALLHRFTESHPGDPARRPHRPLRGGARAREARRGRDRPDPAAARSGDRGDDAVGGRARARRPRGTSLRRERLGTPGRARRRAVRPLRPQLELPRADERALPRGRDRSARADGARQHRLREEDGRAGARDRAAPPDRRRDRARRRPAAPDQDRRAGRRRAGRSSRSGARVRARRAPQPRRSSPCSSRWGRSCSISRPHPAARFPGWRRPTGRRSRGCSASSARTASR